MFSPVLAMLVLASGTPAAQAAPAIEKKPQERKICQIYEEIGSRLSSRKVCLTAQQWDDKRREQRGAIERSQQNVGQGSSGN